MDANQIFHWITLFLIHRIPSNANALFDGSVGQGSNAIGDIPKSDHPYDTDR
jgi:hypothetical protein